MSDILIKHMEMPKSCDECRIMVFEDTNCVPELFCGCPIVFQAHPQGVGRRPDYCPLIEVPSHGDLVDIDALKLAILDVDYLTKYDYLKGVLNAINRATPVIEAEVGE